MDSTQIAFTWLLLAFITAGIAQGKGQSGFGWFILSAIFGPLALAFLVMFGSDNHQLKQVEDTDKSKPKDPEP
jgi:hypothetical protein